MFDDARWEGKPSVGLNTFELLLDFDDAGGGWARLPELEFEVPLDDLEATGRTVTFQIEGPRGLIRFDAAFGNLWMTGVLGTRSRQFPFTVRRGE